ncbi:ABC transporter ATP-binding protein [Paenibacillus sp. J2TS4]|uniref:ABC transporter ATP-binding protein n=1 Tax=Paenibacillus sp. J2TS4 TaxID=2807194 RepID=UPI001AFF6C58|nr:ABC transporter ATP-binding protein [Paenibacillus sp. J2TS4]GIP35495.1 ABC transporter ATP-binding protein [Paenibacillus sp. J2TS4]
MIEIHNLSKQFKKDEWAIRKLDLTIPTGMFGLLGPNGAGKTTFMRILATLLHPTTGTITMNGRSLSNAEEVRQIIGYLPQFFEIYPQLTGYEFLDYAAVMKGIRDKEQRKSQIVEILKTVNLQNKAKHKVKTYSGGMKQRLGIAQALLASPEVLIVDEPTVGLDPEERIRFRNLLAEFSINRTVLLSTHFVADIESSCERLAVMKQGELAFSGTQQQLQACAQDKVWQAELAEEEYLQLLRMKNIQLVHSRRTAGGMECKWITDEEPPFRQAAPIPPSLEDGYLSVIGGEAS